MATCLMTSTMIAVSWMATGMTQGQVATAMTASYVLTPATWKKPKWNTGILIDNLGGGGGEGLAAVGGHYVD